MQALVIKVKNNVWYQNFTERLGWYVNLRASVMCDLPPPHFTKTSRFPWNLAHKKRDLKVFIWNCDMLNAVWIYMWGMTCCNIVKSVCETGSEHPLLPSFYAELWKNGCYSVQ